LTFSLGVIAFPIGSFTLLLPLLLGIFDALLSLLGALLGFLQKPLQSLQF
jgi:hypothetical protein